MNSTSIAIINSKAPYSIANGKEALDLALIFGSYEQDVALCFIGDGVWQLVDNTNGELLNIKDYLKTLDALPFYDIEHIYVCQQSLSERNITATKDLEGVALLSPKAFSEKLKQYQHIVRF